MDKSCVCKKCVNACKSQPGWFMPGEPEKAAKLLKMEFKEFKDKYLIVDYWASGDYDSDVLAPRKIDVERDRSRASFSYAFAKSPCIFLKKDRCMIHDAKPYECRESFPCDENQIELREKIAEAWRESGCQAH